MNFQMFKLDLEKAEELEIKLPTSAGSWKKQEFQKNIYFCFIDYAKAFDCVDYNKLLFLAAWYVGGTQKISCSIYWFDTMCIEFQIKQCSHYFIYK